MRQTSYDIEMARPYVGIGGTILGLIGAVALAVSLLSKEPSKPDYPLQFKTNFGTIEYSLSPENDTKLDVALGELLYMVREKKARDLSDGSLLRLWRTVATNSDRKLERGEVTTARDGILTYLMGDAFGEYPYLAPTATTRTATH